MVEVRVTHGDPKEAALWANTLADAYMDYSIEGQVETAKRAYKWVNERLAETQTGMQEAQDKLLKSYQGQDLYVPEGSVSAITTSITKLNEDHIQAQARRIELEAQLGEFAEMRRRGRTLDAVPQVAADERLSAINGKIQSLTLELARLREKYKEGHPEVQRVQVQMQQLHKDKDARVAEIEESLRAEYRQLQRREAELRDAIDAHKSRAADQSRKLTELESLRKQADSAAGLYTTLLQKLNETNIAASIQNNNVRLLDRAIVPTTPVWPRKRQFALFSLLGGLVLGAGFVLLRDALDDTLKDADDVERHLHLDLLAAIPRYGKDDPTLATEAYQNLRTALLFARRGDGRPGGARDGHGTGRGQDDDAAQRREAARGVGRERRGGGRRPAPGQPPPAPRRAARARAHRPLPQAGRADGPRALDAHRRGSPWCPRGPSLRTRRRCWRARSSRRRSCSCAATIAGFSSTPRRSRRSPTRSSSRGSPTPPSSSSSRTRSTARW